jgi:hypothetical protein
MMNRSQTLLTIASCGATTRDARRDADEARAEAASERERASSQQYREEADAAITRNHAARDAVVGRCRLTLG